MAVLHGWTVEQCDVVEVTPFVILQLEVEEDQRDDAAVGHVDGPGALGVITVLERVPRAGDHTRETSQDAAAHICPTRRLERHDARSVTDRRITRWRCVVVALPFLYPTRKPV